MITEDESGELKVDDEDEDLIKSDWQLFVDLLKVAGPNAIGLFISELPYQSTLIYVGKLDDKQKLAGAGLAISMINCLCIATTVGISSVLETLVSQSYARKQHKLCGLHFNRNLFVNCCLFVPIIVFFWYSQFFMTALFAQDETSARHCQTLLRYLLPGMLLNCLLEIYTIYFSAMGRSYIPMLVQMLVFPLNLVFCEMLFDLGLEGIAIALDIAVAIPMVIMFLWLKFQTKDEDLHKVFIPFNFKQVFSELKSFSKLAFAGFLLLVFEIWSCEALIVLSGTLGVKTQATIVIIQNIGSMLLYIQIATSLATSAIVGGELGEGNIEQTKRAIKVSSIFNMVVVLVMALSIQPFIPWLSSVYTSNAEMQDLVIRNLRIYITLVFVLDGAQIGLQGVIKGLGLQEEAQIQAGVSLILVGIPCAYLFSSPKFIGLGASGIWYGYLIGLVLLVALYLRLLLNVDFADVYKKVLEQAEEEERLGDEFNFKDTTNEVDALHRAPSN